MKRRKIVQKTFIIGLLIAWIAVAFYGWKQTQTDTSDGLTKIVIGYQAGDEFDISKERGVLAKKMKAKGYKVVFKEFQNGSAEMQALASGSIDYARIGDTPGVSALASGTNLTIQAGEFVALVGMSGSGKTTLLRMISGLEQPTEGSITHSGQEIKKVNDKARVMFQDDRLLPWMTVLDNLSFGQKKLKKEQRLWIY